ncbi:MAG: hypothetical protein IT289_10350 [Oligoflexia bacterium]|nr:hypothetical protein [Oligoflexia bacterium]
MMISQWPTFDQQELISQEFDQLSPLKVGGKRKFARDGILALNQVLRGLAAMYPHKRSLAFEASTPEPLQAVLKGFIADGYSVSKIGLWDQKNSNWNIAELSQSLKKDTLFFLVNSVDPVLGVKLPVDSLVTALESQGAFVVTYQGPDCLTRGWRANLMAHEVSILDPLFFKSPSTALILWGDRIKMDPFIWGESQYTSQDAKALIDGLTSKDFQENEATVKKFEGDLITKINPVLALPEGMSRVYDRAGFCAPDINGDAVASVLNSQGVQAIAASACYWRSPQPLTWLQAFGFSEAQIEAMVVIPLDQIKKPGALDITCAAINEVRSALQFKK